MRGNELFLLRTALKAVRQPWMSDRRAIFTDEVTMLVLVAVSQRRYCTS